MQKNSLINVIRTHQEDLINNICNRLQKLPQSHYEIIDFERHQEREEDFLNALLEGVEANNLKNFLVHVENLSIKRSREGYKLDELQQAFNIFEEELWNTIISNHKVDSELIQMLTLCHQLFTNAKDHVAQIYLKKTIDTQKELDNLSERFYVYRHDKRDSKKDDHY